MNPTQAPTTEGPWAQDNEGCPHLKPADPNTGLRHGHDQWHLNILGNPPHRIAAIACGNDHDSCQANAAFIVEACNNHARLLSVNAELTRALEELAGEESEFFDGSNPAFLNARAALSLSQVKP